MSDVLRRRGVFGPILWNMEHAVEQIPPLKSTFVPMFQCSTQKAQFWKTPHQPKKTRGRRLSIFFSRIFTFRLEHWNIGTCTTTTTTKILYIIYKSTTYCLPPWGILVFHYIVCLGTCGTRQFAAIPAYATLNQPPKPKILSGIFCKILDILCRLWYNRVIQMELRPLVQKILSGIFRLGGALRSLTSCGLALR